MPDAIPSLAKLRRLNPATVVGAPAGVLARLIETAQPTTTGAEHPC